MAASSDSFPEKFESKKESQSSFVIPLPEIIQDVTKWVAYDLFLRMEVDDQVPFLVALKYGTLSGLAGNAIFELLKGKDVNSDSDEDWQYYSRDRPIIRSLRSVAVRFLRAGLEGAALFASYEGTINFFENNSIPPAVQAALTKKFTDIADDIKQMFSPR